MNTSKPLPPLNIAVVGHTNTGKTSLMRTLTRDSEFGEVDFRPGSTRHVEAAQLLLNGEPVVELFDTPGIEDPIALLELVEVNTAGRRMDGPERILEFLHNEEAQQRFEQEARVLKQMLASDAAFYVIDARDPVLAKHKDELELLRYCGIPILPLLNFVSSEASREVEWREALARVSLHAIVRFDTVAPALDGERILYEKLATLLDHHKDSLKALIESRQEEARKRHEAALTTLAELLVNVAACRRLVQAESQAMVELAMEQLNDDVRRTEQACIDQLLAIYQFRPEDLNDSDLPMEQGQWQQDLFDPVVLQQLGERIGGGAAAGAAAGAGIDLMVGGMTLGAAAAIGALAGGGLQTLRHYGRRLLDNLLPGQKVLRINDNVLRLLSGRQVTLINALEHRGHAASEKLAPLPINNRNVWSKELPKSLRLARANPEWSDFNGKAQLHGKRAQAITDLGRELTDL